MTTIPDRVLPAVAPAFQTGRMGWLENVIGGESGRAAPDRICYVRTLVARMSGGVPQ
jgi:hypothetical protein